MTFAKFAAENGRPVNINPTEVRSVIELTDRLCMIQLDAQLMINIPLPVHVVVFRPGESRGQRKVSRHAR